MEGNRSTRSHGDEPFQGGRWADRYVVERELSFGRSGMLVVAYDTVLEQSVLLRLLKATGPDGGGWAASPDDALERLRQVSHPNVARVYEVGEHQGHRYFVTELVRGPTLAELLRARPTLGVDLALTLGAQVCEGLAAIHEHGLLHRAITPDHVRVHATGRAVLTGLELSHLSDVDGIEQTDSEALPAGAISYLAPEQASAGHVDAATDLYAVGVLLHQMLTGKPPCVIESTPMDTPPEWQWEPRLDIRERLPPDALSEDAATIVMQCLATKPSERPTSARDVARRLRASSNQPSSEQWLALVLQPLPAQAVPREAEEESEESEDDELATKTALGSADSLPRASALLGLKDRFIHRDSLGEGAMGKVVRAFDKVRRHEIALKYLKSINPTGIYDFKQEFRLLSGLVHPNIVTLYELIADDEQWVLSMELIEGAKSFLDHVRPYKHLLGPLVGLSKAVRDQSRVASRPAADDLDATRSLVEPVPRFPRTSEPSAAAEPTTAFETSPGTGSNPSIDSSSARSTSRSRRRAVMAAQVDVPRLRHALLQLVDGIDFVHQHGLLHRDLKPSNVLVGHTGQVVVCDFGLVVVDGTGPRAVSGTPAYMSPEQAKGGHLTPASDFYSVGVMLYEALTGELPVTGSSNRDLMAKKAHATIRPPGELDPEVDRDLAELCMKLLDVDPLQRPGAAAIREVLRGGSLPAPQLVSSSAPRPGVADRELFIGRQRERARLSQALVQTRRGRTATVVVSGPSGLGKSTLVSTACEDMRNEHDALVLWGRCYQAESVPFKAVDAIVDSLADYLESLGPERAAQLVPASIGALCVLFPVLRRVGAVSAVVTKHDPSGIPSHLVHTRAREAFGELVLGLAARRPLVIVIDDLQWGDLDSIPFLRELMHAPQTPGVLFIAIHRNDTAPSEVDGPPLIDALNQDPAGGRSASNVYTLELSPLEQADAAQLMAAIAGSRVVARAGYSQLLADAGGNPMFVAELAHALALGEPIQGGGLDVLLARRIEALPVDCQRLLAAVATAAWPQPLSVLCRALELEREAAVLAQLRAARMIRVVTVRGQELVALYHDRVREVAVRTLVSADDRKELHRKLAVAFEQTPQPSLESLAVHWAGAGDDQKAGHYALEAGEHAFAAQAFRRAADHYARALALGAVEGAERVRVQLARADALFLAGSVRGAAAAYREAAQGLDPDAAGRAHSQRMICLLRVADMQGASESTQLVGNMIGFSIPRSTVVTLASIVWSRLTLAVKPPKISHMRRADEISEATRFRLEMLSNIAGGLSFMGQRFSVAVHTRYLRDALRVGDPHHIARALSGEAVLRVLISPRGHADPDVAATIADAKRAAEAAGSDALCAYVNGIVGLCGFLGATALRDSADQISAAVPRMERDMAFSWIADNFRTMATDSHAQAGAFGILARQLPSYLDHAKDTGNEFLHEMLGLHSGIQLYLAHAQPDRAREFLMHEPPARYIVHSPQHWWSEIRRAEVEAYEGAWGDAAHRLVRLFKLYKGMPNLTLPSTASRSWLALGRYSIVAAVLHPHERKAHLARARKSCAKVEKFRSRFPAWAGGELAHLRALLAAVDGNRESAVAHLREAIPMLEEAQSSLLAMPLSFELGRLVGGDEGSALMQKARTWMDGEGIVDHERFVRWVSPVSLCYDLGSGSMS